jgi:hypothetical protein
MSNLHNTYKQLYLRLKQHINQSGGNGELLDVFNVISDRMFENSKNDNEKISISAYNKLIDNKYVYEENKKIKFNLPKKIFCDKITEHLTWNILKNAYKNGCLTVNKMIGIGRLRRITIKYLIEKLELEENCYMEFGSDTNTSDLDFTYITYRYPEIVVSNMISFYNSFYTMYDAMPSVLFDTNYYICNTIVSESCFSTITNYYIKNLFMTKPIKNNNDKSFFRMYNYYDIKNDDFNHIRSDGLICMYIQMLHLKKIKNKVSEEENMKILIQSATLFYTILNELKQKDEKQIQSIINLEIDNYNKKVSSDKHIDYNAVKLNSQSYSSVISNIDKNINIIQKTLKIKDKKEQIDQNNTLLILRTLYYIMSSASNEAYISDDTYKINVLKTKNAGVFERILAFIDNFIYIYEWYCYFSESKENKETVLLNYFDRTSKYIYRCMVCINDADSKFDYNIWSDAGLCVIKGLIDKHLLVIGGLALYWTKHIRGIVPFDNLRDVRDKEIKDQISIVKNILSTLTMEKLYRYFEAIYNVLYTKYITSMIAINPNLNSLTSESSHKVPTHMRSLSSVVTIKEGDEDKFEIKLYDYIFSTLSQINVDIPPMYVDSKKENLVKNIKITSNQDDINKVNGLINKLKLELSSILNEEEKEFVIEDRSLKPPSSLNIFPRRAVCVYGPKSTVMTNSLYAKQMLNSYNNDKN